jgi:hypothetical protein
MIDDVLVASHTISSDPATTTLSLPAGVRAQNDKAPSTSGLQLKVMSATINRIGAEQTRPKYYYYNSNQVVTLKMGPGAIHSIVIGGKGAGGQVLWVFDSLSSSTNVIFNLDAANVQQGTAMSFDIDFYTALTVSQLGSNTPADLTFVYE